MVGFLLLMMGLFILARGGGLKWGIGLTAVGILLIMNKVRREED
jgi:hypothetical protein